MSESRKNEHIELAFQSQAGERKNMGLNYEPMLSGMTEEKDLSVEFAGKRLSAPLWISSMTGGAKAAKDINKNLALAAGATGIGMGLGSCRSLLDSNDRLEDFTVRKHIGDGILFANLGIAQVEELVENGQTNKITEMVKKIEADGLIIHVNPLQEFLQPEGDRYRMAPIETVQRLLEKFHKPLIIKEVGQGMGPKSLEALCALPLEAVEFAAYGGTNFTKLEHARHKSFESGKKNELLAFSALGHSAEEMVEFTNAILEKGKSRVERFIISGGVNNVLQGHALKEKLKAEAIIGMAQSYLRAALVGEKAVEELITTQTEALRMAARVLSK